jgi:protein TonB
MLSQPDNVEARDGFGKTVERVLANARNARDAGNLVEARRLADRALDADPNRPDAVQLVRQIRQLSAPPPVAAPVVAPVVAPVAAPVAPPPSAVVPVTPTVVVNTPAPRAITPPPVKVLLPPAPTQPLPGPVTRLPPLGSTPAVAVAKVAAPPVIIRPDPLAARIVNAPDPLAQPRPRIYARKVEPLPIAGYVRTREPEPVAAAAATPSEAAQEAPAPSGLLLPADSFEKLVVTDPVYPLAALRSKTEGWVQLEFTITPSGAVRDIAVIEGQPKGVFDQSAADALAKWRFKPRYVNGQPATQRSTLVMHFNLES